MDHASDKSLIAASPWWRPDPGTSLVIRGGSRLVGTYPISGAKNAILPLIVSALLTPHLVTLCNAPASLDVAVLSNLLQRLGVGLSWSSSGRTGLSLTPCADQVHPARIDGDLVGRMLASVLLLGEKAVFRLDQHARLRGASEGKSNRHDERKQISGAGPCSSRGHPRWDRHAGRRGSEQLGSQHKG